MANTTAMHCLLAAIVPTIEEVVLESPSSLIEASSCNLHVLDPMENIEQVSCMTIEDWQWAQLVDPILRMVIAKLQDGTLV